MAYEQGKTDLIGALQAEIARLRAENERLISDIDKSQCENEQLRSDLDLRNQTAIDRKAALAKLEAENERLRISRDEWKRLYDEARPVQLPCPDCKDGLPSMNWRDGKPYDYCPECGREEQHDPDAGLPTADDVRGILRVETMRPDENAADMIERLTRERDQARDDLTRVRSVYDFAKLEKERDALREALEPFADIALWRDTYQDAEQDCIDGPDLCITPRQIRAARIAIGDEQSERKE